MAIYLTDKDGSDQHFDTYAEFEQAMVLMSRIGGNKVPQDLLDEVSAKYVDKEDAEEGSSTEYRTGDIVRATEDVVGFGGQYFTYSDGDLLEVQTGGTGALCLVKDSWKGAYVSENLANIELVCRREDRKDIDL